MPKIKLLRMLLQFNNKSIPWFAKKNNVSHTSIYRTLKGESKSILLSKKIDEYINSHLKDFKQVINSY